MPCRPIVSATVDSGATRWRFSKTRSPSLSSGYPPGGEKNRDHARPCHRIVVGETAVIEDDVSILQSVTLGGTASGDRPKIREGVMIGAGAIRHIEVGRGAKSAQAQWC